MPSKTDNQHGQRRDRSTNRVPSLQLVLVETRHLLPPGRELRFPAAVAASAASHDHSSFVLQPLDPGYPPSAQALPPLDAAIDQLPHAFASETVANAYNPLDATAAAFLLSCTPSGHKTVRQLTTWRPDRIAVRILPEDLPHLLANASDPSSLEHLAHAARFMPPGDRNQLCRHLEPLLRALA